VIESSKRAQLIFSALADATVALHGQVNNFAVASLTKTGAGTLTRAGNTYTLDFGTLAPSARTQSASLAVLNSAIGPADLLSGTFDLAGPGSGFILAGFGSFANLVAGASFGGLGVLFDDGAAGSFVSTIVLHASGSNASGFEGRLDDTTIVLRGAVAAVPEAETYTLMISGLLVVAGVAKRRRQRRDTPQPFGRGRADGRCPTGRRASPTAR
jgi:hypothetical protein